MHQDFFSGVVGGIVGVGLMFEITSSSSRSRKRSEVSKSVKDGFLGALDISSSYNGCGLQGGSLDFLNACCSHNGRALQDGGFFEEGIIPPTAIQLQHPPL
ncbi:uncharacterized protein LOC110008519 [Amborella trichopoda]|uniref:uncharacterized protein LOC110008519 n=1 Tax=Amborella trichopoda TaxID=13333 RepID=UPI0009BCDB55|nr:uncharacterized protein LOC110008519 [Amborella trichopoda]|eukprot:XP_020532005.1 uncharacterized protein LOC110008519 [Amborella trichopoda]